jgi:chromosomal replication initiation ATPase DnaA
MMLGQILRQVSQEHFIAVADIKGPSRVAHILNARKDAISRMRAAGFSLGTIAMFLKRDKTTITYHCYQSRRESRRARYKRIWANVTQSERDEINRGRRLRRKAKQEIHA